MITVFVLLSYGRRSSLNEETVTETPSDLFDTELPDKEISVLIEGTILPGKGMLDALTAVEGISLEQAFEISESLKYDVDFRFIVAGERFVVEMHPEHNTIKSFSYMPDPVTTHRLFRNIDGSLEYELIEIPTEKRYRYVEGEISTTLNRALNEREIEPSVAATVCGILECIINFRSDARKGDKFTVFLEERYHNGDKLRGARVLFASYDGVRTGRRVAYYFSDTDKNSAYNAHYTKSGEALIVTALRYPVDRVHVTSPFGYRIHPVTRRRSFHNGVDYRGSIGDPVYAVASGVVIDTGYDNISGNRITIEHPDKTRTAYYHLNRIRVRRGQRVIARQRIGDIGRTGRVTGPHLHFGVMDPKGNWINPMNRRMIATKRLEGEKYARFLVQMDEIDELLSSHIRKERLFANGNINNPGSSLIISSLNGISY